jgi:hypothetical protein
VPAPDETFAVVIKRTEEPPPAEIPKVATPDESFAVVIKRTEESPPAEIPKVATPNELEPYDVARVPIDQLHSTRSAFSTR